MFRNSILALAAVVSVFVRSGNADSLVLISQSGGQYDYGIQLDANHGIVFAPGDSITLTGLAGVTGASVLPNLAFLFTSVVTTPTSATVVATTGIVLDPLPVSHTLGALSVNSTVLNTGAISYQIQAGGQGISGTVTGPVASVPEPPGWAMAAAGMLAWFWLMAKTPVKAVPEAFTTTLHE